MPKKTYYTITEAAKKLKITRPAVLKAIRSGRLKAKFATVQKREWQIPIGEVDRFEVSESHKERGLKNT